MHHLGGLGYEGDLVEEGIDVEIGWACGERKQGVIFHSAIEDQEKDLSREVL